MTNFNDIKKKGFLLGFYSYTRILHTAKKFINLALRFGVSMIPDAFIWPAYPLNTEPTRSREDVKIIMAKGYSLQTENIQDITNTLNLVLNLYWDNTACESGGGIKLFDLKKILGKNTNLVWISYLFRNPGLDLLGDPEEVVPHLKYMFVDLVKDTVYIYGAHNIPGVFGVDPIEVMFDEVSLNPAFKWD